MPSELMIGMMCGVSSFLLGWALLLRIKMGELEKKLKILNGILESIDKT